MTVTNRVDFILTEEQVELMRPILEDITKQLEGKKDFCGVIGQAFLHSDGDVVAKFGMVNLDTMYKIAQVIDPDDEKFLSQYNYLKGITP